MIPNLHPEVPSDYPYPTNHFPYEIIAEEEDIWHILTFGRDSDFQTLASYYGLRLAYYVQSNIAYRSNPLQSYITRFVFEKLFFFQDYTLPFLWIYFPFTTFIFSYPIGTFIINAEYYFPFFFFFIIFFSFLFYVFSLFFYYNRSIFDFFSYFLVISYFIVGFPLYLFYSFPIFFFGSIIFFFANIFMIPLSIRFVNYIKFFYPNYFSTKFSNNSFFLPPPSSSQSSNSFDSFSKNVILNSFKPFIFQSLDWQKNYPFSFNFRRVHTKGQFTKYPFFNNNLKGLKTWLFKFENNYYYSFSSFRFKKGLNDIRQFFPNEGPAIYDPTFNEYDLDRPILYRLYEELPFLVEDEFELDYGPTSDFVRHNDASIALESNDEWGQLSSSHFVLPKYKYSKVPFITNSSSDMDFDIRPVVSNWLKFELGRVYFLKIWLRQLSPKHSNSTVTTTLLNDISIFPSSKLSAFFNYFIEFSKIYFFFLDNVFNIFFPPYIIRTHSRYITKKIFFSNIIELSKVEKSIFFSFSKLSMVIRVLFSLETFFINNFSTFSFEEKLIYFSKLSSLLIFFTNKFNYNDEYKKFILKCTISQISRMLGMKKKF